MQPALSTHQKRLWRLCYRMTGSAAEADDLVQETFRRALETPPPDTERDLGPWLTRVAVNLSRDALRARKRRGYTVTWLPSPIETGDIALLPPSGEARYGERESVTFAFLIALEALSASQRAVLLLRDVLDYSVVETAEALALSEANVKTTLHRARKAMEDYDARALPLTPERVQRTEASLRALCMHLFMRNVPALEALLAADVRARNDGGGEFFAAQRPVYGLARVIKFHLKTTRRGKARLAFREINGLPALVADIPSDNPRIARRGVVLVELDAHDKLVSIDTVVASAKLGAIDFSRLALPGRTEWGATLRAALSEPPLRAWLPRLCAGLWARGLARVSKRDTARSSKTR
jgi:RNA polymerase sigma-70 factor (ECF subfamily)